MNKIIRFYILAFAFGIAFPMRLSAEVLFQTATLGEESFTSDDLGEQGIDGLNVGRQNYLGARFEVSRPTVITEISGHFVGVGGEATLFGAIIALDNELDLPNSADLSTRDVLGTTLLEVSSFSSVVTSEIDLVVAEGLYAVVFGSGLFGADGNAVAVANGENLGQPSYIAWLEGVLAPPPNIGWFEGDLFDIQGAFLAVDGQAIPEPVGAGLAMLGLVLFGLARSHRREFF